MLDRILSLRRSSKNSENSPSLPDQKIRLPENEQSLASKVGEIVRNEYSSRSPDPKLISFINSTCTEQGVGNLMGGTVNLVNFIIGEYRRGAPIDTLVFLDKSARNGSYLLHLLWSELKKRDKLPDGVEYPKIRFIDIGRCDRGKDVDSTALALLTQRYRKQSSESQKIVIVDEVTETGDTLRKATGIIDEVFGVNSANFVQFRICPPWYSSGENPGVLGIADPEKLPLYDSKIRTFFSTLAPDQRETLLQLVERIDKTGFNQIATKINQSREQSREIDLKVLADLEKEDYQPQEIRLIYRALNNVGIKPGDESVLWSYLDSAGGFIGRKIEDKKLSENGRYYRLVLKAIVLTYAQEWFAN